MIKKYNNFKPDGFTLIEIMVAATIVGLLSTIGISGFQAVTKSGRDALRKSNLEAIRSSLEIYKSENNTYPVPTNFAASSLAPDYINPYPADPKSPTFKYAYYRLTNLTYNICAHLENSDSVTDLGAAVCGQNNNCGDGVGSDDYCNFKLSNP